MVPPVSESNPPLSPDDALNAKRQQAKMRLYVICQVVGWGLFFGLQLVFSLTLAETPPTGDKLLLNIALLFQVSALGILLTHVSRHLIKRWGWSDKSWLALAPRILILAAVVSLLWSVIGFSLHLLLAPADASLLKQPLPVIFLLSVINGTVLLIGWYSVYFFYQVFDRYNRSEIERLRLATVVKETELRALKSQVNPHFIFNSLNSVRALIDEDPTRARQAVTQLANLLRYSLQSGQLEVVSFEDELAVVNDYLALEQVRHEERLRLRLDVAPETLHLPVPPMVLQTLVENAIKYGIAARPEGGEITIRSRVADDTLVLTVANPGRLSSAATSTRAHRSTGVGLRNAEARLQLLFGQRATVELHQVAADLVEAEARLPLLPEDRPAVVAVPREARATAGRPVAIPTL